jgi:hypothetical protein
MHDLFIHNVIQTKNMTLKMMLLYKKPAELHRTILAFLIS